VLQKTIIGFDFQRRQVVWVRGVAGERGVVKDGQGKRTALGGQKNTTRCEKVGEVTSLGERAGGKGDQGTEFGKSGNSLEQFDTLM